MKEVNELVKTKIFSGLKAIYDFQTFKEKNSINIINVKVVRNNIVLTYVERNKKRLKREG